jgi:anaerobic ribonucleoside-triphosphate reductase
MSYEPKTREEIDREITTLRERLPLVTGSVCDVYDRITGYYQPIRNWNTGKAQEGRERVRFDKVTS